MYVIPDIYVGYQQVPKVATTSTFAWLNACVSIARTGELPRDKVDREDFKKSVATFIENVPEKVSPYQDFYRFALTRDPIRRFLSMYSNRVIHHRELSRKHHTYHLLQEAGLAEDPEINLLVDRFEAYCALNYSIFHHSKPMMQFLGPDLGVYQRLVDISELGSCIDEMRRHFVSRGLNVVSEKAPELNRLQVGGPKLGLEVLNPYSFEKLLDFYREDYEKLPTVDLQKTKDAYVKARADASAALTVAVGIAATKKSSKKRQVALTKGEGQGGDGRQAKSGKKRAGKRASAAGGTKVSPVVTYIPCEKVRKIKVSASGSGKAVTGYVVLARTVDDTFRLVLNTPAGQQFPEWGRPSPALAKFMRGNPHAENARFLLADVELPEGIACELCIVDSVGNSLPVARISL